mmetsp:Transcript_38724/g.75611  ORF Transcript_38724/g.75611 Transcript_38724/m.75611 type:complete len:106 (+) Transcript_38724:357-674(+)
MLFGGDTLPGEHVPSHRFHRRAPDQRTSTADPISVPHLGRGRNIHGNPHYFVTRREKNWTSPHHPDLPGATDTHTKHWGTLDEGHDILVRKISSDPASHAQCIME